MTPFSWREIPSAMVDISRGNITQGFMVAVVKEILQFSDIKKRNEKYQKIVNSIGKGGVLKLRDSAINIDLVTFISKDWYNA